MDGVRAQRGDLPDLGGPPFDREVYPFRVEGLPIDQERRARRIEGEDDLPRRHRGGWRWREGGRHGGIDVDVLRHPTAAHAEVQRVGIDGRGAVDVLHHHGTAVAELAEVDDHLGPLGGGEEDIRDTDRRGKEAAVQSYQEELGAAEPEAEVAIVGGVDQPQSVLATLDSVHWLNRAVDQDRGPVTAAAELPEQLARISEGGGSQPERDVVRAARQPAARVIDDVGAHQSPVDLFGLKVV